MSGGSWIAGLTVDPIPAPVQANYPFERLGISNGVYPPDQGYQFRVQNHSGQLQAQDYTHGFGFGGPLFPSGGGEYYAAFTGSGYCELYMRLPQKNGSIAWTLIDRWRFADPHQIPASAGFVNIHPVTVNGQRGIEWTSSLSDDPPPRSDGRSRWRAHAAPSNRHRTDVVKAVKDAKYAALATIADEVLTILPYLNHTTSAGPVRYDVNRINRARVQINKLTYPQTGTLIDGPFLTPPDMTARTNFVLQWSGNWTLDPVAKPNGSRITGAIYDAITGNLLTFVSFNGNTSVYKPNQGTQAYYVVFTFDMGSPAEVAPPILMSYRVYKDGYLYTTRAPQWEAFPQNWSIIGAGKEPESESALCHIEDAQHLLTKLYRRADIPTIIKTTAPDQYQGNTDHTVELFRGLLNEPNAQVWGTVEAAVAGWQDKDARGTDCQFVPYYKRLSTSLAPVRVNLVDDPNGGTSGDGAPTPYKVTDMVRAALGWCGFGGGTLLNNSVASTGQIDVPDAPVRFWPAPGDNEDSLFIEPRTELGPLIVKWLADYLGWHLIFDGNAGDSGMWRAIPPVVPDANGQYNIKYTFVDTPPGPGLVLSPDTYPEATAPILRGQDGMSTYREWQVPPEANLIEVIGISAEGGDAAQIVQYARNTASADFYSTSGGADVLSADPTNPDYLGTTRMISIVDPGLNSVDAVNWLTRRAYDRTAHTLQFCSFEAPLWFLSDPDDVVTVQTIDTEGRPVYTTAPAYKTFSDGQMQLRPLRFGDPIAISRFGGAPITYLVYSVHMGAVKDNWQTQQIEAVAAIPLTAS